MKAPRALTIDLEGKQVKVYRNLKYKDQGLFSVQFGGLVVAVLETVQLSNVVFKVTETGRQRVIASRQKNVHAYAIGTFTATPQPTATEPISYNPYRAGHFFRIEDQAPIHSATAVVLSEGKAYASAQASLLF
ncbi:MULTISPECIES: hypothetical protein [Hymenobacter]|uniref:Uncharacterized protein n=1 Tax=Hymenobacter mucosus TaxID=1411120 RepID=A0A239B9P0_9BACT|nr:MULTISPECIES: hypothetical protein [Hymenobacter]MDF7815588.1 hypothetical protein [Hymenobacter sp. YC55]SNS04695.1 hypothetical protein SAMN06269173_12025 [Hymenobacter mucosus]